MVVALSALSLLALVLLALAARLHRREQALTLELASLHERVRELGARVDAAEADVAHAVTQAEMSETLLVEKGVADEEDIEDMRRRFHGDARGLPSGDEPGRDGQVH
ncbi:MAG: hypothetical protein QM767_22685 [Anaeromyxobacter sp.]